MIHSRRRTLRTQRLLNPEGAREFSAAGRAPCLLGLHGFTGTASELRPLVDRVAEAGFAVDVPLMQGHGQSADALQEVTFDAICEGMRERFREQVRAHGRVVLCGFSMGSLVALKLAAERPEGLAGLVILGCAMELHAFARVPFAAVERLGWRMPDWYFVKVRAADMTDRDAAKALTTYDRHPLRAALEVYRAGQRLQSEVGKITCPTLVLHGKKDMVCRLRGAEALVKDLGTRDASLKVYARSAHVIAADVDRDEVARDVITFVERFAR